MDNKLLVVCGPTATGKTALALKLAQKYNGELVSADSRQVYRGMDIGTGKDISGKSKIKDQKSKIQIKNKKYGLIPYDMKGIPLWMYDVVNPDEEFSVAHYQCLATSVIGDIQKRGKLAIVVGGTGLYITSLLSPIETSYIPPDKKLRKTLQKANILKLQGILKNEHPFCWNAINLSDRQNPRRIIRKIEIARYKKDRKRLDGKIVSQKNKTALIIGLTVPYPVLYKRIDERVEKRVKDGITGEIQELLKKGYSWDLPSINTFGYKEWKLAFQKVENGKQKKENDELIKKIIQKWKWDEHGYARRQMAWFKKMKGIEWIDISTDGWEGQVESMVGSWYTE